MQALFSRISLRQHACSVTFKESREGLVTLREKERVRLWCCQSPESAAGAAGRRHCLRGDLHTDRGATYWSRRAWGTGRVTERLGLSADTFGGWGTEHHQAKIGEIIACIDRNLDPPGVVSQKSCSFVRRRPTSDLTVPKLRYPGMVSTFDTPVKVRGFAAGGGGRRCRAT